MRGGAGGASGCDTIAGGTVMGGRSAFKDGESAGITGADEPLLAIEGGENGLEALRPLSATISGGLDEGVGAAGAIGYVFGLPDLGRTTITDSVMVSAGVVTLSCMKI